MTPSTENASRTTPALVTSRQRITLEQLRQLKIRPASRRGTWAVGIALGLICLWLIVGFARNPNVEWPVVGEYLFAPITLQGLVVTIYLSVVSLVIGIVGGVIIAVMGLSKNPVLVAIAGSYTAIFRSVPLLVQIIFWGYLGALVPDLTLGIPFTDITFLNVATNDLISPTTAALLALGLNEVAYASEIIRGGINAVDRGQVEAAHALGMKPGLTTRRVVLPQAMRSVIPPLGNEVLNMVKATSLVSVIAGADLLTNLQNVYAQTYQVIPLLLVASIWYGVLTLVLSVPQHYLEKRFGRGHQMEPNK